MLYTIEPFYQTFLLKAAHINKLNVFTNNTNLLQIIKRIKKRIHSLDPLIKEKADFKK